ncbi:YqzE family protein [Ornithinibacillus halophilus]|uniref:YqzE family protein n=1 Tax=Ornithinibacillus halophilus TaxID=930117 RepID=UPI000932BCF8|nr:YqzE family protein [Ornithinibacillus halophilus]
MSSNDYIRYVTEQFVSYVDLPKEERKKLRMDRKEQRNTKQGYGNKWFGVLPLAVKYYRKKA